MKKKTIAVWATAFAAALGLGAISAAAAAESPTTAPPPGFLSSEETLAEFDNIDSVTDLVLPEGRAWPHIPPAEFGDTEGAFQVGYVESVAKLYWLCAWEDALVDATDAGNAERANHGRSVIASFAKGKWFSQVVDPEGEWRDLVLKPALAGDLTGVKADLAACGYYEQNQ